MTKAVIIGFSHMHVNEVAEECAKRGINISIEKPIAVSLDEAKTENKGKS